MCENVKIEIASIAESLQNRQKRISTVSGQLIINLCQ